MNQFHTSISSEITEALEQGKPVVALESTIVSHGMPFPQNVETALAVEEIVRSEGAIPATIAIVEGKIKVGLSKMELDLIGSSPGVQKCSRRDLPFVVAQKSHGATTVSATMMIAHSVGIRIFATGGIGGVHRNVELHGDVSADLIELKQTPVVVVCAGIKSILDIPRTLEMLESYGVPVCSIGSDEFPAFFTRASGVKSPRNVEGIDELVNVVESYQSLEMQNGFLIANPIAEENEFNASFAKVDIAEAILKAEQKGVKGKDITPFLLAEVNRRSGGKSLESNIELIKSNALVASRLAVGLEVHKTRK